MSNFTQQKKYACLMYHGISGDANKFVISVSQFLEQLNYCVNNNIEVCSIERIREKRDIQDIHNNVVFSFDDGNKSDLWAAERLAEKGFSATFFVVKKFSETSNAQFLNESEIKKIYQMGHSIGVHGKTHNWWTKIEPQILLAELTETKKWIENITGGVCVSCSAPGGQINKQIIEKIESSGEFDYIRSSMPLLNSFSNKNINGIAIEKKCTIGSFKRKVAMNNLHIAKLNFIYSAKALVKKIIR